MKKVFIISIALFVASCSNNKEVKPLVQDIKELVFASGQLEWDDSYNLTALTDGVLKNADFDIGNLVEKGDSLATIDNQTNAINTQTSQQQLAISNENLNSNSPALQQLQQNILFAESKYQQDKTQEERYKRLYESQSVSKVEYENAQLNAKNSLANFTALKKQADVILQQAKQQQITTSGQLKNNEVVLNYNKIIVTEGGTIIKKFKTTGDYVRKGDVIATIANEKEIQAVLNVDENSVAQVKLGQTVFIKLNTNKNTVYNGKVSEILSAYDQQTQSFICKVDFDQVLNGSLYGTQLEANILTNEKKNALLIPRQYLGFGNKVNVKGKDETIIIKTGIISTEYIEVLEGINQDDILLPLKP
jgi:multidrug efflux pump subunit AcrA (membrane-fusion protein)